MSNPVNAEGWILHNRITNVISHGSFYPDKQGCWESAIARDALKGERDRKAARKNGWRAMRAKVVLVAEAEAQEDA